MIKLKEGDIYNFSYSSEYREKNKGRDYSHCFDGQLIAKKDTSEKGGFILADTYWSFGGNSENYSATPKEWQEKGTLTFVVNLNDTIKVEEYQKDYYNEKDWFNLSYQHNCYEKFAIKKGAKKDKETMLNALRERIKKAKSDADYAIRRVEEYSAKLSKVESGDLTIFI